MSSPEPVTVSPATTGFAADVAGFLQQNPRQLPSRYFYDALGSALFDAICRLPWYRVTRAETALLVRRAAQILDGLRRPLSIAELGCGNGEKLAVLLDRAGAGVRRVHLIDISPTALLNAKHRLTGLPDAYVTTFQGTYEDGLAGLMHGRSQGAWVVLFLGSNIGNFDPPAAGELLRRIRGSLAPGDALLLGTDLVKPVHELLLAYDDPLQVTAAFNRNLLRRINDELGGTFDLEGFRHRAMWNSHARRVEMHLVSTKRQVVRIAAIDLEIAFEADEWIWTESSYKFDADTVVAEGVAAGFRNAEQWIDHDAGFALTRFTV
jgi:L-histidine Nalpha-methyltransferase